MKLFKLLLALALLLAAEAVPMAPVDEDAKTDDTPGHSAEEMAEAREEFESIDTNKDGFVTREEILEMEEVPEQEEIDEFFETYDTNKDGKVTFDEILVADDHLRAEAKGTGAEEEA